MVTARGGGPRVSREVLSWGLVVVLLWILDANLRALVAGQSFVDLVVPSLKEAADRMPFLVAVFSIGLGVYVVRKRERYAQHVRVTQERFTSLMEDVVIPMRTALESVTQRLVVMDKVSQEEIAILRLIGAEAAQLQRILEDLGRLSAPEAIEREPAPARGGAPGLP